MSQFIPRFQSPASRAQKRDTEMQLRTSPQSYSQEDMDASHFRRQQESQRIKNLSFWDNSDEDNHDEEEWSDRQTPTPFILAIIILVIASTLLWFIFQWASGESSSTPPVISADTSPFKVRPENPGGMMIPHQDKLIYGRLSQNASQPVERLLPPPEQPIVQPPMAHPQQQAYPQGQGYAPPPQAYPSQQMPNTQHSPRDPYGQQAYPPVQNQPLYPQQTQQPYAQQQPPYPQTQTPYPQGPQPAYQGQPSYAPNPQYPYGSSPPMPSVGMPPLPLSTPQSGIDPAVTEMPKHSTVEEIKPASDEEDTSNALQDGAKELDQLIAREIEKPTKKESKKSSSKPMTTSTIDPHKYKAQIASLPSRAMAEQEMKRLRTNHGSFFDKKPWNIQKVELGPDRGTTYRLIIGSFPNHGAITKFCKKLRSEKIGCLIIAPENE
ncbi:MAG: hypothetical protein FJX71_02785 [Alphaproteobacteria bacterium]|nr:hypothetical protein [Alphaproteobacteria bacterium]